MKQPGSLWELKPTVRVLCQTRKIVKSERWEEFFFFVFFLLFLPKETEHQIKAEPPPEMPLKCDQTYGAQNRELLELDVLVISQNAPGFGAGAVGKVFGVLQKIHRRQGWLSSSCIRGEFCQMTEEEQFALALKMSEQEARQVNCQEEEEEELLRKAIAESLSVSMLLSILPSTLREDFISLSPTFGRVSSGPWRLTPRRLFTSPSSSSEATGHEPKEQSLPCTGHSAGEASAGSSPVLWKSWAVEQCGSPRRSGGGAGTKHTSQPGHKNEVPDSTSELSPLNAAEEKHKQEEARDTVHYYWGIPFCPKGVDPNQYTKVILCQLEVYQKSLKQAQRQLLHKKEFGNPVVPSSSSSQNELGKGEEISRENGVADDTEDGDPDMQKESESMTWLRSSKRREAESPGHSMEEEKNSTSDDEPTTSYCQVRALPLSRSWAVLKRSPDAATENSTEEEISVCPGKRTVSECSPVAADRVSCPLCDQGFPATEIELHAMYCNGIVGEAAAEDSPVLTRRQREARSKAASGESGPTSLDIDKCEKCYLCKSLVPLLQYQRHVDSCLQAARQAQGTRRLRSTKVRGNPADHLLCFDVGRQERGLLRMLELSESKSAGGKPLSVPAWLAGGPAADSPSSLRHLPFNISPAEPGVSFSEAPEPVVDLEPHAALRLGSQQQTKGCRRRRRKV
uniref:BRCA1-A complex subunit RAP80 n=1 Tax=Calidris pygmaea TaxID=425635 RepID=A0A8C3PRG2_9CHAR